MFYSDGIKLFKFLNEKEKSKELDSDFIQKYKETSIKINDSKSWKTEGFSAKFQGEGGNLINHLNEDTFRSKINDIVAINDNEFFYSLTVNEISALIKKDITLEKDSETRIFHSNDTEFISLDYDGQKILISLKNRENNECIAISNTTLDDYQILTEGDCKDFTPSFSKKDKNKILYSSAGIGRDQYGNFVEYGDSEIYSLDLETKAVACLLSNENVSYYLPKEDSLGNLYYIKKPTKIKKKINILTVLLDVLLIPVKLVMAIYYFLETFTMIFTGKKFMNNNNDNKDGTKNSSKTPQEIFIEDNIINIQKETKKNKRFDKENAGIVPQCYELIKNCNGEETVLKRGILSYDFDEKEDVICCNGKIFFEVSNGVINKIGKTNLSTKFSINKNF